MVDIRSAIVVADTMRTEWESVPRAVTWPYDGAPTDYIGFRCALDEIIDEET